MTYDPTLVENDPFLITARERLNELEAIKDAAYKLSNAEPTNTKARLSYDAALMCWAHAKVDYERMLKAVLGL